jgi:hypothetical protein
VSLGVAQSNVGCANYDHPTQWPTKDGSAGGPEYVPTGARLADLLRGTFALHLITTEGGDTPLVSRWRIRLVPADSVRGPARRDGLKRVMVGTRIDVERPSSLDSLRRGRFLGEYDIEMLVDPDGVLSWQTAPGSMDAGLHFRVSSVDSTGFSGRWIDGSIAVMVFQRGSLSVAEKVQGYYCALKER